MNGGKKNDEIFLHQTKLIKKLEKQFEDKLSDIKAVDSPAIVGEGIVMENEDKKIQDKSKHTKYRSDVRIVFFG